MSSNGILRASREPIAIVGIGFRSREAAGAEQLWTLLRGGRDVVGVAPTDRWKDVYDPDPLAPGRSVTRWGSFLDRVDEFDGRFFGVSPKQAASMDPQHRLLLEVAWEALEDAGMSTRKVAGRRAGVFVGMMFNDYGRLYGRDLSVLDGYSCTANTFAHAANRVSFFFDLHGPSIAVDTNCSGSLVAIHQACQSIATGESEWAVAGGVSLILTPDVDVSMSKASALSPTGRCRTWDERADGFVRGEGGGLVVLKPLSRAVADGDRIYALVLGTATNHTGRGNWIMEPSSPAQRDVIQGACESAGVSGKDLDYVELHGTGTLKGDPVEADGLAMVTALGRSPTEPCRVGSIKTNLGHLDAAAGVAGLIKTALCIHHRELVPSLHFETPNPEIALERLKFRVQTCVESWPLRGRVPLAGVTAIGFGGTNAHAVLSGVDRDATSPRGEDANYMLPLSARTERARCELAERYADWLRDLPRGEGALYDLCSTAGARRTHHEWRLAVAGDSPASLEKKLRSFLSGSAEDVSVGRTNPSPAGKVVFVFPGHGPQWVGMARDLFDVAPFRDAFDACDERIRKEVGWSVREEIFASPENSRLEQSDVVQPVLFSVAVSLARLWQSWGVEPDAVVGHSFGEIAAACVAGAISLESAVRIVCARGRLTRRLEGRGGVAIVEMPASEVWPLLDGYAGLEIGGANSPTSTIVTGRTEDLEAFLARMATDNVFARRVKIAYASHSRDVDGVLEEFARDIGFVEAQASRIPIHSTVRGALLDGAGMGRDYWATNLRSPVRFSDAIQSMDGSHDLFVEISPHPVLVTPLEQILRGRDTSPVVVPSLRKGSSGPAVLGASLARLYAAGCDPDWTRRYPAGRVVSTPTYPWQRERAWLKLPHVAEAVDAASHPLLACHVELSDQRTHVWDTAIGTGRSAFLRDHRVQGVPVLPASVFIEMIVSAASATLGTEALELLDLELPRACFLSESESYRLQLTLTRDDDGGYAAHVQGRPDVSKEAWRTHATARVRKVAGRPSESMAASPSHGRLAMELSKTECYEALRALGLEYGPAFQGIESLTRGEGEAFASVRIPAGLDPAAYYFHPALHDACLHVAALIEAIQAGSSVLPVRIAKITLHSQPGAVVSVHARLTRGEKHRRADIRLANADGTIVQEVQGIELANLDRAPAKVDVSQWIYEVGWTELSASPPAHALAPHALAPHASDASWLILADAEGVGDALASRVRDEGGEALVVHQGPAYRQTDDAHFEARPQHPDDLRRVIEILRTRTKPLVGVLHLWSLDLSGHENIPIRDLDSAILSSCGSAVHLVQALERDRSGETAPLWFVTRGAQPYRLEGQQMAPLQAPLWGLGKALSQELPARWGGLVDLDPSEDVEKAARSLWGALPVSIGGEDEIVLRGGQRYGARLNRRAAPPEASKMEVRSDAAYLVTGGTGGLGLEVARWLAERGAKHIVLAARTANSSLASKVRSVEQIESKGARVETVALDVGNGEAFRDYLDAHRRRGLLPIRGVFHLAGTVELCDVLHLDATSLLAPMRSKIHGSIALDRGLDDADVFVLFSSASSVIPSPRLGHYAAANAFLDALAHQRRALGRPCTSINWGLWSDVGYIEQLDRGEGPSAIRAMKGIPTDVGIKLLDRIVGSKDIQTVVWPSSWSEWARLYPAFSRSPFLAHLAPLEAGRSVVPVRESLGWSRARLETAAPYERLLLLQGYVHGLLASHLGLPVEEVAQDLALEQLGFDSLQATELKNRIRRDLDVEIPVVRFLGAATIATIAETVLERLTDRTPAPSLERPVVEPKSILDGLNGMSGASLDELLGSSHLDDDEKRVVVRQILGVPKFSGVDAAAVGSTWAADLALDDDIDPRLAAPANDVPKRALLTGATGYLGAAVLHDLCRRGELEIHCLVRASDGRSGFERIRNNLKSFALWDESFRDRIVPILGDLSKAKLGLRPETFDRLATDIDVIHHMGAAVNFLFSYSDMRETNVLGTKEILRLASSKKRKPTHVASTYGVFLTPEYAGRRVQESEFPRTPPGGGYGETKWVTERLVRKARARGLPVSVYRPPFIGWNTQTGVFNPKDFVVRLVRSCLRIGLAPDIPLHFSVTPLEEVSASIVEIASKKDSIGRNYNLVFTPGFRWLDLVAALRECGPPMKLVPYDLWRAAVISDSATNPMRALLGVLPSGPEGASTTYGDMLLESRVPGELACDNALFWRSTAPRKPSSLVDFVRPFVARVAREESVPRLHLEELARALPVP
jgi:myxalamid-type polyketide synthase MxaE and MxaD